MRHPQKHNSTLPKNLGFTLIELLVVISIIGLLSSIILSNLNTIRAKARDTDRIQSLKEISKALEFYYDDNGHYPIGAKSVLTNGNFIYFYSYSTWNNLSTKLHKYIKTLPTDPNGGWSAPPSSLEYLTKGTGYAYWTDSTGSKYQLMGRLEKDNPLECKHTDYKAIVPYIWWNPGESFCDQYLYAAFGFIFNQKLYVISSGQ